MHSLRTTLLGLLCAVVMGASAHAAPQLDFDVDGPGSSASIDNITGPCVHCFAFTTMAPGLDSEIFSLAEGESRIFDFFDVTVGGVFADVSADATATLAFEMPAGVNIVGTGSGGFFTVFGILSAGVLTWDNSLPVEIALSNGSTFAVDFTDIHEFGIGHTATVEATITATNVVPEPTTLAVFGLGLAGIGLARRRKAA